MLKPKVIAIVGLMGVGKTTIGAKLAQKMRYYFVDCDQEIEDREMRSINEIFAKSGEKYFREVEKNIIKEIILRDEEVVLSLGGGAFLNEETRALLKEKAVTIWLYASIDEIVKRIGNKNNRPLLNQKTGLKNKRQLLEELKIKRYPYYNLADMKFETTSVNHDVLIGKIIGKIKEIKNDAKNKN